MNKPEQPRVSNLRSLLTEGLIPLGQAIPVDLSRQRFIELFENQLKGKPREWRDQKNRWTRYSILTEILWFSARPVSFTFRDEVLALVEFSDPAEPDPVWDYSLETQKYVNIKRDMVKYLGKESLSNETDAGNMEAVWNFAKLVVFVCCDARTGGCGIGLRPS